MLVGLLEERAVSSPTLHQRQGWLIELVRALIGVVPSCDRYLAIARFSMRPSATPIVSS